MRASVGVALVTATVAIGAYLVATDGGALATAYVALVAGAVALTAIRQLADSPPPPQGTEPLLRLSKPPVAPPPTRPLALLEWESALLAARAHGPTDRSLARRITPLVEACLRVRLGMTLEDPRAEALLGPAWKRLLSGSGAVGDPLHDLDELTRRLEAL